MNICSGKHVFSHAIKLFSDAVPGAKFEVLFLDTRKCWDRQCFVFTIDSRLAKEKLIFLDSWSACLMKDVRNS
jgi:hypothetical protein